MVLTGSVAASPCLQLLAPGWVWHDKEAELLISEASAELSI